MSFHALQRFIDSTARPGDPPPAVQPEEQNSDYESGVVLIDDQWWRIRTARITPSKPGAFVAVWKRNAEGSTRPFTAGESLSGLLIFVEEGERFGVFRFTRAHLVSLGYVTSEARPGKRGFRVYPSWCSELNPQALRSQFVQATAFAELQPSYVSRPAFGLRGGS